MNVRHALVHGLTKPRDENTKYFDYLRGRHCVEAPEVAVSEEISSDAAESFNELIWLALDLTHPLEEVIAEAQERVSPQLQQVIRRYAITGRLNVEATLLLNEIAAPSFELLACLLILIRIGAEVHRNDSAPDICLLLSDVLLAMGIELIELGIAGPLAGYIEAAIYPHAATQGGLMLSNLGTSFVEACLLLEAVVISANRGPVPRHDYSRLARWHLQHGPEEDAGGGLPPSATVVDEPFSRDFLNRKAIRDSGLPTLKLIGLQRLREKFSLAALSYRTSQDKKIRTATKTDFCVEIAGNVLPIGNGVMYRLG